MGKGGTYRSVNRFALGLLAYCLALPLLLLKLSPFLPDWIKTCSSIRLLGRPCPLCGLTRGLNALLHGRLAEACAWHILTVPVALFMAAELVYRAAASVRTFGDDTAGRLIRLDRWFHMALVAGYLVYSLAFYMP